MTRGVNSDIARSPAEFAKRQPPHEIRGRERAPTRRGQKRRGLYWRAEWFPRNRASPFNYDSHGAVVRGTDRFRDGHADHAQRREPEDEGGDAQAGSRGKMEPAQGFLW